MPYSIPHYIVEAGVDDPALRFVWDDTRVSADFTYEPDALVERLRGVTLRGRITLGIGMYEWIVWRFRSVSSDPLPIQVAEAAWCANVDRRYMTYEEWDRQNWIGPVRGPLWCAMTWLMPMVFFSDDRPEEWESGLSFLSRLGFHVIGRPETFERWLEAAVERMLRLYPDPGDDPFEDLFGEYEEVRRGPLVPREALDPSLDYDPSMAEPLVRKYLREVDYRRNPLLRSPEELLRQGVTGAPYAI